MKRLILKKKKKLFNVFENICKGLDNHFISEDFSFNLSMKIFRSIRPEVFLGKGVLKICSKFRGQHLCQSAISIKLLCSLPRHGCSPVNLLHIFRTLPKNSPGQLLLNIIKYDALLTSIRDFSKRFSNRLS